MTDVIGISVAAAVLAVMISLVKKTGSGIGAAMSIIVVVWLGFISADALLYLKNGLGSASSDTLGDYLPYVVKSAGIGFFAQIASDVCRDNGQISIGEMIETVGKLGILTVVMPLIKNVLDTALGFIKG